eukprot:scaffold105568_cov37-Tisochrysis_lutea.AAC.2
MTGDQARTALACGDARSIVGAPRAQPTCSSPRRCVNVCVIDQTFCDPNRDQLQGQQPPECAVIQLADGIA